jgi:hypothetical protein
MGIMLHQVSATKVGTSEIRSRPNIKPCARERANAAWDDLEQFKKDKRNDVENEQVIQKPEIIRRGIRPRVLQESHGHLGRRSLTRDGGRSHFAHDETCALNWKHDQPADNEGQGYGLTAVGDKPPRAAMGIDQGGEESRHDKKGWHDEHVDRNRQKRCQHGRLRIAVRPERVRGVRQETDGRVQHHNQHHHGGANEIQTVVARGHPNWAHICSVQHMKMLQRGEEVLLLFFMRSAEARASRDTRFRGAKL